QGTVGRARCAVVRDRPPLDPAGALAQGAAADRAVHGALGSVVLPDARLQHSVSLVPGHEPGGSRAGPVELYAPARAAGERGSGAAFLRCHREDRSSGGASLLGTFDGW